MAERAEVDTMQLLPAESMALTVARQQARRGEDITPHIGMVLVMALDRLTGAGDWRTDEYDPFEVRA